MRGHGQNLGKGWVNFNEAKDCKGTWLVMKLSPGTTFYGFRFTKSIFIKVRGFFGVCVLFCYCFLLLFCCFLIFFFSENSNLLSLCLIFGRKPQIISEMGYLASAPAVITISVV